MTIEDDAKLAAVIPTGCRWWRSWSTHLTARQILNSVYFRVRGDMDRDHRA